MPIIPVASGTKGHHPAYHSGRLRHQGPPPCLSFGLPPAPRAPNMPPGLLGAFPSSPVPAKASLRGVQSLAVFNFCWRTFRRDFVSKPRRFCLYAGDMRPGDNTGCRCGARKAADSSSNQTRPSRPQPSNNGHPSPVRWSETIVV